MDFEFTSEQTQLADALRRYLERDYGFEARKAIVASPSGTSDAVWSQLVELGITALALPEAHGGFDGGATDLVPVLFETGRALLAEPFMATMIAAQFLLGPASQRSSSGQSSVLEGVAAGAIRMAAALGEPHGRYDWTRPKTTARVTGDRYVLDGTKNAVSYGAQAQRLIVSATGPQGLSIFLVDPHTSGVERRDFRVLDGHRVATVTLSQVEVGRDALLASGDAASALLDAALDAGVAFICAEAVGVMDALNAATLEYAKTRKQFGQPIARFQVLQHRMVDMFVHLEQSRSMAFLSAATIDDPSIEADERRRRVSAAKVRIGRAARFIGQQAVQIHGGMGVTDELPAAHLFKRLTTIELALGDTDHHLARFIEASRAQDAGLESGRTRETERQAPAPLQRAA